jgi:ribonuclease G
MDCPCCDGTGKVLLPQMVAKEIEREVERLINQKMAAGIIIEAHPLVIHEIENEINGIMERYNKNIILKQKHTKNIEEYDVKDVDNIKFLC